MTAQAIWDASARLSSPCACLSTALFWHSVVTICLHTFSWVYSEHFRGKDSVPSEIVTIATPLPLSWTRFPHLYHEGDRPVVFEDHFG